MFVSDSVQLKFGDWLWIYSSYYECMTRVEVTEFLVIKINILKVRREGERVYKTIQITDLTSKILNSKSKSINFFHGFIFRMDVFPTLSNILKLFRIRRMSCWSRNMSVDRKIRSIWTKINEKNSPEKELVVTSHQPSSSSSRWPKLRTPLFI